VAGAETADFRRGRFLAAETAIRARVLRRSTHEA
jgi:hypothetical protein